MAVLATEKLTGMHILVLGAGAGGGVPQWNSNSEACRRARTGRSPSLTQSGLAVSADGERWVLLNASPDLRHQINANPALWPRDGVRHSPIISVVLTNGDVDHVGGLLTMREGHRFAIYGTRRILDVLDANSIFGVLNSGEVPRRPVDLGRVFDPAPLDDRSSGLRVEPFEVPGKVALYLEDGQPGADPTGGPGDTIGLRITSADPSGVSFCYIPGCARIDARVLEHVDGSDLLLFDGTLWQDDEMALRLAGRKTGRRMGHVSMSGPAGAIAGFAKARVGRKAFIHINNTNPVLLEDSAERAEVKREGWEIAYDGMEIRL